MSPRKAAKPRTPRKAAKPRARRKAAKPRAPRKILITGIAGSIGRALWRRLVERKGIELIGVDVRNWLLDRPPNFQFIQVDINRNRAEDIFRTVKPHTLVHLAFQSDQAVKKGRRHNTNVIGTQRLLGYCRKYGVKKVIVVSQHQVYGASPGNPSLITEDMPLKAAATRGELGDLIEFDHICHSWMYEHGRTPLVLLRPVFALGPNVRSGFLYHYLNLPRAPVAMGFNPMLQILHEDDVAEAISCALKARARGIYNVTGSSSIPLLRLLKELHIPSYPVPHPLLYTGDEVLFRLRLSRVPPGSVQFLQYNCVVNGKRIAHSLRRDRLNQTRIPV